MRTLLALGLALLATGALADHVYSHRFVFEGRLVGSDDTPLPGRAVEFFSEGEDFLEPCRDGPQQPFTDEWGDFRYCFHHHALEPGTRVGVRAGNASALRSVDLAFRRSFVTLQEPNETGIAPASWNVTFRISGRAWSVGPTDLEGVPVYGVAAVDLPVNLTVRASDGTESTFRSRTDGFGDFDLVVETEEAREVSLTLEAQGRSQPVQLDRAAHRTFAPIYLPGATAKETFTEEASVPQPGSSTPRVTPALVVALALGLVLAILASRRKG